MTAPSPVRRARPDDVPAMVDLVHELARHVAGATGSPECALDADGLHAALFSATPALFGHVAAVDGEVVGLALWFLSFSTWRGVHGIYLEDLVVSPAHRGGGLGRELVRVLALECTRRGYARLEWSALDRYTPALAFYRSLGSEPLDGSTVHRLTGDALRALAHGSGEPTR